MFKFKLESVLSLKQDLEDTKKRELGMANIYKEQLEFQKNELLIENELLCNELKEKKSVVIDIHTIRLSHLYRNYILKQIKQKEIEIQQAQKVVDQKREALLVAMKERKILENLKQIKKEQHDDEAKKAEQLIVDEIVSYKYRTVGRSEK